MRQRRGFPSRQALEKQWAEDEEHIRQDGIDAAAELEKHGARCKARKYFCVSFHDSLHRLVSIRVRGRQPVIASARTGWPDSG